MANYEFFEIERHGQSATLWMNKADKRNAMGRAFWEELPLAMKEIGDDPEIRAVVLAGRGRDFTIGLDLKEMLGEVTGGAGPQGSRFPFLDTVEKLQASVSSVAECSKPVIAAIHGYCLGGGIDLISACDVRYASEDSIFSIRETRIAIVADIGTLQRLPAIIGRGHVAELAYSGDDISAQRAAEIHLANRLFPDHDSTVAAARDLADRIAANSPMAVEGTKRVLDYCEGKSVADGLRYVATWNAAFLKSADLGEAMQAFAEKRAPVFKGK